MLIELQFSMKKIFIFIFLLIFVSFLVAGNLNFLFSSNTVVHSDDDYKLLYGSMAYGWDTGFSYEPFWGAEFGIKYGQSYDSGFLSYTKENLTLNKTLISGFMNIYPLTLFMKDFFFYIEPLLVFEMDFISYKEESVLSEVSGSKAVFSFGGGISLNLNRKTKLLFSVRYRNLNPASTPIGKNINTEGIVLEAGLRVAFYNL